MLTIQPVNFTRNQSFGSTHYSEYDGMYTKHQYEADKTRLEEQLEEINEVIENTQVPKPVRAFGKVVSVGIGAALGFVSMKFGAQGMTKLGKKGIKYVKGLMEKPVFKNVSTFIKEKGSKIVKFVVDKFNKLVDIAKNNKKVQDLATKFTEKTNKFKETGFGKKVVSFGNKIADSKFATTAKEKGQNMVDKIKSVTSDNVENAVVNLFAVSGGVTGGITALQEATKGQE